MTGDRTLTTKATAMDPWNAPQCRAFTLVELLVSLAVIAIVLALIGSIVNSASLLTGASNKRMDADSQARLVFDRLAGDLGRIVNRTDVDYQFNKQSGNDSLYFYSEAPATASITGSITAQDFSSVALVGYRINSSQQMERLGQDLLWSASPKIVYLSYTSGSPDSASTLSGAFSTIISTDSNYQVLGENVFRLEFCFLLKPYTKSDGTVVPAYYSNVPYNARLTTDTLAGPGHTSIYQGVGLGDVQAIIVTLAILDANSRKILSGSADWNQMISKLPDPSDSDLTASPPLLPARNWQHVIDSGGLAGVSGIPPMAASQVRIYQRMFAFIPSTP